ncbi:glycosyltransferase family 4 protein [Terriglobus aquaticus]|uniref:Glycosyltransferase family 4 protein n=1 Tax=Terriglobus aquaticus TaxID=940139 RepID=A0ABW9KJL6_9BACT|nr:glycosyltransferase family 4 protein [Terriglobus aquaticus]
MQTHPSNQWQFVLVHGGARDSYQVALALHEAGLLRTLVTDLFASETALQRWSRFIPPGLRSLLEARSAPLPSTHVQQHAIAGLLAVALERWRHVPFALRRSARRLSDRRLGRAAGHLAASTGSRLLAYSYFAAPAFSAAGSAPLLFQVHPHPLTVRRILHDERALHPQCASSLDQEWELALPEHDLKTLIRESETAHAYIVASSFTQNSLIEHGVPAHRITVVPYGVDLQRFHPRPAPRLHDGILRLLFVGRINQRKGLLYLLQALSQLSDVNLHLTICGRVVDDLQLFRPFADRITLRPSVSAKELAAAYQQADLFVFPSLAEGFGQVLLEALASGLPILSTTHTAAPDLIEDGVHGWIVPPRDVDQLAHRIRWASEHRDDLHTMAAAARSRAELYTWQRFRAGVVQFALQHARATVATSPASDAELVQV